METPTPVPLFDIDVVPVAFLWSPWVSTTGFNWGGGLPTSITVDTRFTGSAGGTYKVQVMVGNSISETVMANNGVVNVELPGDPNVLNTGAVSFRVMNTSPNAPLQPIEISAPNDRGFRLILPNAEDQFTLRSRALELGSNPAESSARTG